MRSKQKILYLQNQIQHLTNQLSESGYNPYVSESFSADAYREMLTAKDNALCSVRYIWRKLLELTNLTSQELEAFFYANGSLVAFERNHHLQFGTYAKGGNLNGYGHLDKIRPIDFGGNTYDEEYAPIVKITDKPKKGEKVAIVIHDYTPLAMSTKCTPRSEINGASTINDQVYTYTQLANNIAVSIKKALALCDNEDQKAVMQEQLNKMIFSSSPVMAVVKNKGKKTALEDKVEMFNFGNNFDTQNYCQQIDYYDKVRRAFNGIPAPDTFEKKERKINAEAEDTSTHIDMMLFDGLVNRQTGLYLMKKYLDVPGIENLSIELNPVLIEKEEEQDNSHEVQNE